jgi:hypothetical protein
MSGARESIFEAKDILCTLEKPHADRLKFFSFGWWTG